MADNQNAASKNRPIGISVPLGRPIQQIVQPADLAIGAGGRNAGHRRRYVWAFVHDIEPPLDKATRIKLFCNCQELTPQTPTDDPSYLTSMSFFGGEHSHDGGTGTSNGSACIDLAPALARADQLSSDRLTLQFAPNGMNNEPNVSNTRPKRVEVVIL